MRSPRGLRTALRPIAVLLGGLLLAAAAVAELPPRLERKLDAARWTVEDLLLGEKSIVPRPLLAQTHCLAVFPNVTEAAFGFGGSHGRGVASCREPGGSWSPPAFLTISGGSLGLQIGYRRVDLLLFFVTPEGARTLAEPKLSLGGSVSVAAGPVDREAGISADPIFEKDVYLYSRASGLFAGASLEGSRMGAAQSANERTYGRRLWPEQILFEGKVDDPPAEVVELLERLESLPALAGHGDG